jgi:hypothetical protein
MRSDHELGGVRFCADNLQDLGRQVENYKLACAKRSPNPGQLLRRVPDQRAAKILASPKGAKNETAGAAKRIRHFFAFPLKLLDPRRRI